MLSLARLLDEIRLASALDQADLDAEDYENYQAGQYELDDVDKRRTSGFRGDLGKRGTTGKRAGYKKARGFRGDLGKRGFYDGGLRDDTGRRDWLGHRDRYRNY